MSHFVAINVAKDKNIQMISSQNSAMLSTLHPKHRINRDFLFTSQQILKSDNLNLGVK